MRILLIIMVGFITLVAGYTMIREESSAAEISTNNPYLRKFIAESHDYTGETISLSEEEWKTRLNPENFYVLRKGGTEPSFSSPLNTNTQVGTYVCGACGLPLFSSKDKFKSGTGWPSFTRPLHPENLAYKSDYKLIFERIEVLCHRCGSHIGHVFEDGPPPSALRFCMNGLALEFEPEE